ncbi:MULTISPECIES: hypothetical protein [Lelliottia]|nr:MULTISPECIES: hypothetical protein [Lelliottia]
MRRQSQVNRQGRLTDRAVLVLGLLLAVALCTVIALAEVVFLS